MKAYNEKYFDGGVLTEKTFVFIKYDITLSEDKLQQKITSDINNLIIHNNILQTFKAITYRLERFGDDFVNNFVTAQIIFSKEVEDKKNKIEKNLKYYEYDFRGYKYLKTGQHTPRKQIELEFDYDENKVYGIKEMNANFRNK